MSIRSITVVLCGVLLTGVMSAAHAAPIAPVPEPGTYAMLCSGAVAAAGFVFMRNRAGRK